MADFTITSLTCHREPVVTKTGIRCLANLDFDLGGITLAGCALARRKDGVWDIWPPRTRTPDKKSGVSLSPALKRDLVPAAVAIFQAMGGQVDEVQEAAE